MLPSILQATLKRGDQRFYSRLLKVVEFGSHCYSDEQTFALGEFVCESPNRSGVTTQSLLCTADTSPAHGFSRRSPPDLNEGWSNVTETEAFTEFHEELKLDAHEVAFARGFPNEVRQALLDGGVKTTNSFLQGSLARGTMVSPLKDVDMVVSLDRDSYGYLLDHPHGPDMAMDLLEGALEKQLRQKYLKLRFGPRKRHALPIELGDGYPSFDLVPAFETATDDDDVLIADRVDKRWERSNPRELIRVVAEANKATRGKLIHVVRMVKHSVRTKLHAEFPGLAVESLAIDAIRGPLSYAQAAAWVFRQGAEALGGPIFEPTGRDDLSPKIDQIEPGFTKRAKRWFEDKADEARRARNHAEVGAHNQSIAWWYRVFGPPFRSPSGATSTTAAATVLTFGSKAPRPTRAWRRSG